MEYSNLSIYYDAKSHLVINKNVTVIFKMRTMVIK